MLLKISSFKQKVMSAAVLLLLLHSTNIRSQNAAIDSLTSLLKTRGIADTTRVNLYLQLAKECRTIQAPEESGYLQQAARLSEKIGYKKGLALTYISLGTNQTNKNNFDSAFFVLNKAFTLSNNLKNASLLGEVLKRKGAVYYYQGEADSALAYFKQSYVQFEHANDSLEVIKLLNNIGAISIHNGQLTEAISYFFKCLKYDEAKHDNRGIASDCNNIGTAFTSKKDFATANQYLKRALSIRQALPDSAGIIFTSINIGNVFIAQKQYDSAIKQLLALLKTIPPQEYINEQSQITNNIGVCYFRLNQFDAALEFLQKSIAQKKSIGVQNWSASSMGNIGQIYFSQNRFEDAINYSKQAVELANVVGDLGVQVSSQNILLQSYLQKGQTQLASEAFAQYVKLNDSLYNLNNAQVISEIQTKYETDKKEKENKLLQQENSLKQNALDARNKTILVLLISIALIISIIVWRLNVMRLKKKFIELENQKKLQEDRERISRDLHDNVGGQLSYVMFSLEAKEEASSDKRKEKLKHLANSLRDVTSNLRETIWALNKEALTLQDVSDKLKLYARNMFAYSDLKLRFDEQIEQDAPLNPAFALHLFRMCQEIINNVFKHSQATELVISIKRTSNIQITITDNGVGFESSNKTSDSFGLSNLKTRGEEINATLTIESTPTKGTSVSITI